MTMLNFIQQNVSQQFDTPNEYLSENYGDWKYYSYRFEKTRTSIDIPVGTHMISKFVSLEDRMFVKNVELR